MKITNKLWIGLAEVAPRPGNDVLGSDQKGASVNVIAYATDVLTFREHLVAEFNQMGLDLIDLEDVEPFLKCISEHQISSQLLEIAEEVKRGKKIGFGTFNTFPK